jgi:hypothetical protein
MQMPKSISIEPVNCGNKEHKWYFATKIVLTYCEKKKIPQSLEQFIQTVKGQNNFW